MANNDEQRSSSTIFTTAGQSIAARLIANKTTAKFTKAEISTTNLFNQSVSALQVLTSLDNVQQVADINAITVINENTVNVNIAIDQTKAPNDYQMNSVGLYAKDGEGKEVLYSVTVLKDPVYIHQDAMGSALGIDLETVVGQASNVEISVNPAGAVTNEILKATLADYVKTDDVKNLIPDTVIDGSKPADFKEAVTLEKGAVDGAGNNYVTDDQAVLKTDMRKPANQVASIDEVNAKQDKLDYTPANDANSFHLSPDTGAVTESGNFPALQVKGVDVATAADLKSIESVAWREITNTAFQGSYLFKDNQDGTASIAGTIGFNKPLQRYNGHDDYVIPMPDGYSAKGLVLSNGVSIKDVGIFSIFESKTRVMSSYFPGNALHLYASSDDYNISESAAIILAEHIYNKDFTVSVLPLKINIVKTS